MSPISELWTTPVHFLPFLPQPPPQTEAKPGMVVKGIIAPLGIIFKSDVFSTHFKIVC